VRAIRTLIVLVAGVAVVVAIVMLVNVGTGSAGLQTQSTPLVGNAVVTAPLAEPTVLTSASAHGFTVLPQP
jgi:hypothetical protein